MLKIHSRAPTRIDLAGGTIDLWPLYLFLDRPTTINLGIDLFAEANLEHIQPVSGSGEITLRSEDQNVELKLGWNEVSSAKAPPQLELHLKLLRHVLSQSTHLGKNKPDLKLSTRARSPSGAGLGGSSTLSVAIVGALTRWSSGAPLDVKQTGEHWIEVVRDVETTVIQVPAGVQDYYGAMFGGLQSLKWGEGSHQRQWMDDALVPELERRILLLYSGQSRNSGINNWALFKNFIDNQGDVRARFAQINASAQALENALSVRNWAGARSAIAEEWSARRTLASGISTPEMDCAFEDAHRLVPRSSGKICGAGGGGCFFIFVEDPTDKSRIEQELLPQWTGMRALPFKAVRRGLEVQVLSD